MTLKDQQPNNNKIVLTQRKLLGISQIIALAVLTIILAWISWQAFHAVPSADDFCFGSEALKKGAAQTTIDSYLNWTGRYSSTFLIAFFSSSKHLLTSQYFLVPFIILSLNFIASLHFIKRIGADCRYLPIIFFVVLILSYSLRESIFWLSGGFTYGIACAIFIGLIGEEFSIFSENHTPSLGRTSILSFATLLLAGFNETIMIAHLTLLLTLFLFCVVRKRSIAWPIGLILLAAILGACIVAFAPGNAVRASYFPARDFLLAFTKSLAWIFYKYSFFAASTLLIFYSALVIFSPKIIKEVRTLDSIYFILCLFIAAWASAFTRVYTLSSSGPPRARTVDYMVISLLCFLLVWHTYKNKISVAQEARKILPFLPVFLCIVFVVTLLDRPAGDWSSLRTQLIAAKYAAPLKRYMLGRFESMEKEAKGGMLQLPDYADKSLALTFFDDVTHDPKDWKNACFAEYFGFDQAQLGNAQWLP